MGARRSCGKFWCSFHVVSAQKVVCPKENQGAQGSPNFSCYHLAATAALPDLFGVVKHFSTKNVDRELTYKYKDIESEYVGNLDKLKVQHVQPFSHSCLDY